MRAVVEEAGESDWQLLPAPCQVLAEGAGREAELWVVLRWAVRGPQGPLRMQEKLNVAALRPMCPITVPSR